VSEGFGKVIEVNVDQLRELAASGYRGTIRVCDTRERIEAIMPPLYPLVRVRGEAK